MDRNDPEIRAAGQDHRVVLLAEDVDRNVHVAPAESLDGLVVLLAEDVDRNFCGQIEQLEQPGRPPRGGRG